MQVIKISKSYGKNTVLENISLDFNDPAGVYGILGRKVYLDENHV